MDIQQLRSLEQVIDTTWGRASTHGPAATMSIKASIHGEENMQVKYMAVVNLGSVSEWRQAHSRHEDEAKKAINEYIKAVKKNYKELTGDTIKFKSVAENDSIDVVSMSPHNPRRTAYYRMFVDFVVS